MAKGKKLTDRKRGQIEALSSTRMSSRAIAIKIGRSKTVVNNILKLKDNYGKKNTGGRPKALSSRDERRVCQLASTGNALFQQRDVMLRYAFVAETRIRSGVRVSSFAMEGERVPDEQELDQVFEVVESALPEGNFTQHIILIAASGIDATLICHRASGDEKSCCSTHYDFTGYDL
ncbi:hypothetical protein HNY73_003382 [Argiope bruennichi]|uniref:Tc3 transposase DNA binding domain-containing protein n=1 Tax=Argiope bruennichi TaxID=94029 RepID=A0A8T0FPX9_ARGBR|nr:hypothetical protein HNY73_003382 [Argiope bruennichi]